MSKEWELVQTISRMDEQERYDAFGTCYMDDIVRGRAFETIAYNYGQFLVKKYGTNTTTES